MKTIPYSEAAYQLLHRGAIALADVEANGIKIDVKYLDSTQKELARKIKEKQKALKDSEVMRAWRKTFKTRTNFDSGEQLGKVLFEVMGFDSAGKTEHGRYRTDEASLGRIDHPFIKDYLGIKKDQKAGQFLKGIAREVCDGFLHPFFNLHIPRTYRSSSDSPNFQNLPVRNEEMMKSIRRAFIARKGRRLIEMDYGGIEVRIAGCYNKDERFIADVSDPRNDMHRDMAMECFKIDKQTWGRMEKDRAKKIRYIAKNQFVFPQFYGSYWFDCARGMWEAVDKMKPDMFDDLTLKKHLRWQGLKELGDQDKESRDPRPGTFEHHIQQVQESFWNERYPVYGQWRKDWYQKYLRRGWFKMKTGFICQGAMKRNQVINYPVQGAAFHCLLWSLSHMVLHELKKRRMKTLVVGQIHDCIVADVPEEETDDYLRLCHEITIKMLMEEWSWIIVPLEIEAELCPVDGSWVDKKKVDIPK